MSQLFSQGKFFRIVAVATLLLLCAANAQSASYKVLYGFGASNANPSSGLTFDAQGNAYGVTSAGGYNEAGTVYELSPTTGYHLLFKFGKSQSGGAYPLGNVALDAAGNLYGATLAGGIERNCCGVVFELSPSNNGGLWNETVLYTFCANRKHGCPDGAGPTSGVIFDALGDLYGTTAGNVFELSPNSTGWSETVLYEFESPIGEAYGPIFDGVGNLYGTTSKGGQTGSGTVFELSPSNGGAWVETTLYEFEGVESNDGADPLAGVALDDAGNLYGTTDQGGHASCNRGAGCGIVYELTPSIDGTWTETILHRFAETGEDGEFPAAGVVLDASGNIYGTTSGGGLTGCSASCGTAFRLTATAGAKWIGSLFRFPSNGMSGSNPVTPLTLDSSGNIYGTTTTGGLRGGGVVFKIAQ